MQLVHNTVVLKAVEQINYEVTLKQRCCSWMMMNWLISVTVLFAKTEKRTYKVRRKSVSMWKIIDLTNL